MHLAPDVSTLTEADARAVEFLIEAGGIFQQLHENMKHRQAVESRTFLVNLDRKLGSPRATQNLLTLYYLSNGPVVRGLDNVRQPMLPVDPPVPGGAVYPWDVTREELDAFLRAHPEEVETILHPRTVVRRTSVGAVNADLAALNGHPAIAQAHPGLRREADRPLAAPGSRGVLRRPLPGCVRRRPHPGERVADQGRRGHRGRGLRVRGLSARAGATT